MSVEISNGVEFNASGGMVDPSNLHLKKELTQIRKAARVLRDPGTSSSWRSPINSVRSLTKHHYVHHHKNGKIDASEQLANASNNNNSNNNNGNAVIDKSYAKDKERKVFLYNWRSLKSESERSKQNGKDDVENAGDDGADLDSMSDANNNSGNDSKSDSHANVRYSSANFKYKDRGFTPSIRRNIKKKAKRSSYGGAALKHHDEKLRKQIILSKRKKILERDDDSIRLVDLSDDTEDYVNSEDERKVSAVSLLAELRSKGWAYSPRKLLRSQKKEYDSVSYGTSALSASSYHRYSARNPSVVESWDATTRSVNEASDGVDDQLEFPGQQGCGISCYWSRRSTPRSRIGGQGSCCSPSLSDTLRRKGKSILCGSQSTHHKRRKNSSLSRLTNSRAVGQGLVPLLTNSSCNNSDDEIGEIDLEALSRLDGRRWSTSCRSQEGLEIVALNGETQDESSPENVRSLSHKYRPLFFDELVGQNIVVQSLTSAVSRRKIAQVYLFQGPRGTGKTSMAIIFAASLNCLASEEAKPCGVCRECSDFISGKSTHLGEVDVSSKKGNESFKTLLNNIPVVQTSAFPTFKVFVVKECHLLPSKTWQAFLRVLEKPMPHVVFILETTDADNVPRPVLSRCQKHIFNKISNGDIVSKLKTIVNEESLDVVPEALELIASNSDGSLHDAETMIDQLRLFGKRITVSLVNELIGVVSDEKLLDLLESAMSSNATETVIKARELLDSGVDPIALTSQMATLIVDIIAGTQPNVSSKHNSLFDGRNMSEREVDRLRHALTLLSEAEKHIRISSERSTWFTATLLQLGSMPLPDRTHSGSSRRQSSKAASEEDHRSSMIREDKPRKDSSLATDESPSPKSSSSNVNYNLNRGKMSADEMLNDVWLRCIEKCHSRTLRELLRSHGRLVSVSDAKGGFVAYVAFEDRNVRNRAEGFVSSITNSFETVLRRSVEVKLIVMNNDRAKTESHDVRNATNVPEIPVQRIESIIREQRLETAWLQEMEKGGTPRSASRLRPPERNQVLPQDGSYDRKEFDFPTEQWEDELNREIKALKISNGSEQMAAAKRADNHPIISPSLLHDNSHHNRDSLGYESGSGSGGCSGMFCWKNARPPRRANLVVGRQGTPLRQQKSGRFSWFGECAKSRRSRTQIQR